MITYSAMLDVPRPVVEFCSRRLAARRRAIGTLPGSRALTPWAQAVLVVRWLRDGTRIASLARDAQISQATGYRYIHEGLDVLADEATPLAQVLQQAAEHGAGVVLLDGTLISCDRLAETITSVKGRTVDAWYSGKAKTFAGNVQVVATVDGEPLWVSDVEPGSVHDLSAARLHALPALRAAARDHHLLVLADGGYTGAGAGIRVPIAAHPAHAGVPLALDNQTHNALHRAIRARVEQAIAALTQRWAALRHVSLSPRRIGTITQAALVLHQIWNTRNQ